MAGLLHNIRILNGLGPRTLTEPFAGGAGASLSLLYREDAAEVVINDLDHGVHDFWWTLVSRPQPFLRRLKQTPITIREWRRQRDVYRSRGRVSRLSRGFAAFFLNRCNRSGIIMNGGPIGGIAQDGEWKLNARFNKDELLRRCERVAEYKDRIRVSCIDGLRLIDSTDNHSTMLFVDPPYYGKGQTLYLNRLDHTYHMELAARLKRLSRAAWVVTYDDCPEIRRLYKGWATIRPFRLRYAANERRDGREVMITPKWMRLPEQQQSAAIKW